MKVIGWEMMEFLRKYIIFIHNFVELKKLVMNEMHKVPYDRHLRYQKTIVEVISQYFFPGIKKDIVEYTTRCMKC